MENKNIKKYNNSKRRKNKAGRKFVYDVAFMRQVVQDYETSDLSSSEIAKKYGWNNPVNIHRWPKHFSSSISQEFYEAPQMIENEVKEINELKQQNNELLKKLVQAHLQVTGLETLIDTAEKLLSIDIRKKPGTKQ